MGLSFSESEVAGTHRSDQISQETSVGFAVSVCRTSSASGSPVLPGTTVYFSAFPLVNRKGERSVQMHVLAELATGPAFGGMLGRLTKARFQGDASVRCGMAQSVGRVCRQLRQLDDGSLAIEFKCDMVADAQALQEARVADGEGA